MSEGRIHMRHVRMAGRCVPGARTWVESQGWSWRDFVKNGRPIEDFEATGDPLVVDLIAFARAEVAGG